MANQEEGMANRSGSIRLILAVLLFLHSTVAIAESWGLRGTLLTPGDVIPEGVIIVKDGMIAQVGREVSQPDVPLVEEVGVILPGFIDLHNHLTWNVLPRWRPVEKFNNRYQWQAVAEYDRLLRIPENRLIANGFGCKANLYAEVQALAGGASSVTGSYLGRTIDERMCALGLTRNLDQPSAFKIDPPETPCVGQPPLVQAVVANEVFPMEIPHDRVDWYRCQLSNGKLRALLVHLAEGNPADASARREFWMLESRGLLTPGVVIVHGTALGLDEFRSVSQKGIGLVWSPRSNEELYGGTTNIAAAIALGVDVAVGPDWSPTGNSGMLQELNYIATRYKDISPKQLVMMATSIPAKLARLGDKIGMLTPGLAADILVIKKHGDAPYETVVSATPADVQLVTVGGVPIYGDPAIMRSLLPRTQLANITI
jgi:5-methylthioadenosine/S-adenosylhomocysteine deaminase